MGVVINQSLKNLIWTYIGFAIGALNTLVLYQRFMDTEYFGLVNVLLSGAMIFYPLLSFGMGPSIIRFFSYKEFAENKGRLLFFTLTLPLLVIIVFGSVFYIFLPFINDNISEESALLRDYSHYIFYFAAIVAYFEVFYSYSKINLKSVFGNFLKEIFARFFVSVLLVLMYFELINDAEFIVLLLLVYLVRTIIMGVYSFRNFHFEIEYKLPENYRLILNYAFYIIITSSIGYLMIEIDKLMVAQYIDLSNVAYYAVATFIGIVVAVPGRAMQQILAPLMASAVVQSKWDEVEKLYKKSSINLFVVSGLIFLLITVNSNSLFSLLSEKYQGGETVVLFIAVGKLFMMLMGSNNSIVSNSKYYRYDMFFGVLLIVISIGLNIILIPVLGINGAALATALTIIIYNSLRLGFVYNKFKMQPFTYKTLLMFFVILILYFAFDYFPDFFNPFIQIIVVSALISLIYLLLVMFIKPSVDIDNIIKKYIKI